MGSTYPLQAMTALYGMHCLACGRLTDKVVGQQPAWGWSLDHIQASSLGGKNELLNWQPLCRRCNHRKGRRTVDYRPPDMVRALEALVREFGPRPLVERLVELGARVRRARELGYELPEVVRGGHRDGRSGVLDGLHGGAVDVSAGAPGQDPG